MAKRPSGKRYSQALFELAVDQGQPDQWAESLKFAAQTLDNAEFRALLKDAKVPSAERVKAVTAVLGDLPPMVQNLVSLLVARGLIDLLPQVAAAYEQLLDQYRGRQQVEITSAVALTQGDRQHITRFVGDLIGRDVVLTTSVDENILGGLIIQIGDRLLDGSTRARLEGLRKQLRSDVLASAG
ncbi:MAG: F0F1 ATP synthase subunit delta [SAR202 cluster bacterium]|nr:F0F1 ATP synthase subunit delta [SAR202 cluster bacterium]